MGWHEGRLRVRRSIGGNFKESTPSRQITHPPPSQPCLQILSLIARAKLFAAILPDSPQTRQLQQQMSTGIQVKEGLSCIIGPVGCLGRLLLSYSIVLKLLENLVETGMIVHPTPQLVFKHASNHPPTHPAASPAHSFTESNE